MAITNTSGAGRPKPKVHTNGNPSVDASLDDDMTQRPELVTGFTTQAMISTNNTNGNKTSPYQMIV